MTVVNYLHETETPDIHLIPALRLGCLQHFMLYRRVQLPAISKLTIPSIPSIGQNESLIQSHVEEPNQQPKTEKSKTPVSTPCKTPNKTFIDKTITVESVPKPENTFIKRVRSFVEEKKEWYEERKRRNIAAMKEGESGKLASSETNNDNDGKDIKDGDDELKDVNEHKSSIVDELDNCSEEEIKEALKNTVSDEDQVINTGDEKMDESEKEKGTDVDSEVDMDDFSVIDTTELEALGQKQVDIKVNAKQKLLKFIKSQSMSLAEDLEKNNMTSDGKPIEETIKGKLKLRLLQKMKTLDLESLEDKVRREQESEELNEDAEAEGKTERDEDTESLMSENPEVVEEPPTEGMFTNYCMGGGVQLNNSSSLLLIWAFSSYCLAFMDCMSFKSNFHGFFRII